MNHSRRILIGLGMLVIAVNLCGCEDDLPPLPPTGSTTSKPQAPASVHSLEAARPALQAPHQGRLLPIPGDQGYVEWVHQPNEQMARVYLLRPDLSPLTDTDDARLALAASTGPQPVPLEPCPDTPENRSCLSASSGLLGRPLPQGVIRLSVNGEPSRILLPTTPAEPPPDAVAAPTPEVAP